MNLILFQFKVCKKIRLFNILVMVSVGLESQTNIIYIRDLCQLDHVPMIVFDSEKISDNSLLNFFPDNKLKTKALKDLISYLKWTEFVIIYQDSKSN